MSEMSSGIYTIYCKRNDKYYVGQSLNVKNRLEQHLRELRTNTHGNKMLQDDFNLYGEDYFVFNKEKNEEERFLNVMEGYFINYYDSLNNGYNQQDVNERVRPKEREEITRKKQISQFKKLKKLDVPFNIADLYSLEIFYVIMQIYEEMGRNKDSYEDYDIHCNVSEYLFETYEKLYDVVQDIFLEVADRFDDEIIKILNKKFSAINILEIDPLVCSLDELIKTNEYKVNIKYFVEDESSPKYLHDFCIKIIT